MTKSSALSLLFVCSVLFLLPACGITKDAYDALERDKKRAEDSLQAVILKTKSENDALRKDSADMRAELAKAQEREQKLNEEAQKNIADRERKLAMTEKELAARDAKLAELQGALNDALLNFRESGLSVYTRGDKVYVSLSDKLVFPSGKTDIDERGKKALNQLASVLNKQNDIAIQVEGHTDNTPITKLENVKDNWDLSVLRATQVVRYLTEECNVDAKRVTAAGRGQYFPVDAANNERARAKNRRIEVVITPKLGELMQIAKADARKGKSPKGKSAAKSKKKKGR